MPPTTPAELRALVREVIAEEGALRANEKASQIREVVHAVISEDRAQRGTDEFYIKRKELYDTHQKTKTMFRIIDDTAMWVGRTLVYGLVIGAIALVVLGLGKIPK